MAFNTADDKKILVTIGTPLLKYRARIELHIMDKKQSAINETRNIWLYITQIYEGENLKPDGRALLRHVREFR